MYKDKPAPHRPEGIIHDLRPRPFGLLGKSWVALLMIICAIGLFAYVKQLRQGLSVTGLRDFTLWGIYISNFVFFVAISLVGSLISAILKLSNVAWRTPLTRIAEIIAVSAIIFAAVSIIIDMGRPDRFLNVIIHARIQSPITWDVIVITTYLVVSALLLYMPLIPDFALLRDQPDTIPRMKRVYKRLALGWSGTKAQRQLLERLLRIMIIGIIPIAFGIHTVTSWLFATTLRPGWDSTNFGPYFVSGAFMVGAAAVIVAMYLIGRTRGLEPYLTRKHFDYMSRLLVMLSLVYLYFNINEYFIPAYKMKGHEAAHLNELFSGRYAPMFWSVQLGGMILPIILLLFRRGRTPLPAALISVAVIVGAWFKRFLIVVPTLEHPYMPIDPNMPANYLHYFPTFDEWAITAFTLAGSLLIITLLVRYLPAVPIAETIEESEARLASDEGASSSAPSLQLES